MATGVYDKCVKDVMSRDVVAINAKDTVHEALEVMSENKVSALPVIDRNGRCIGILSTSDIMEVTRDVDAGLNEMEHAGQLFWGDFIEKLSGHAGHQSVMELMSESVVSATPDTPLSEAARKMLHDHIHRLPVIDDNEQVIGIVSTTDVLTAFVECAPKAKR